MSRVSQNFRKIQPHPKDFQAGWEETCPIKTGYHFVSDNVAKREKEPRARTQNHMKTSAHVFASVCTAMAGGQNAHAGRIVTRTRQKRFPTEPGRKGTEI